jgi:bacillithiol system protein YtxJ
MTSTNAFCLLSELDDLDRALAQSSSRPALIFKHSATCGISAQAYDEIDALLAGPSLYADLYLVDVWQGRPISNAIASRLRTSHESPQVLLIHDGSVRWSASHFRVTADAIRVALASVAGAAVA